MRLQKGKWYVCIRDWSDDGWLKFYDGMLLQCEDDGVVVDVFGIRRHFDEAEAGITFREATEVERNIASATEVDMDKFVKQECPVEIDKLSTLEDIYRMGAEAMLRYIRTRISVKE